VYTIRDGWGGEGAFRVAAGCVWGDGGH
jgi:hypothetical protein